ncbi:RecQ family ATP-dependent DNA helicase [Ornithinibacillus xuwenensis]|uniref:RecQ family ATP-dependent DNA helicase n=1 Tax=Ornithinibacillus xuwenensis TaxID=3144668 RepID=A0ABU9XH16_9BACI
MSNIIHLEKELENYFGYSTFRVGQKEIIEDVLKGKDVLGVLPTGTGKSVCYQLPARLLEGITIVVSPLISLMMDQVKELKANHFKDVIAINSFLDFHSRKKLYRSLSNYKIIYLSPEILQQKELQNYLSRLHIALFVIDEAHCISQWGHEFRPDYQKLYPIIEMLGNPNVLALSATATNEVQNDIKRSLNLPNMVKHIYPIDRNNIMLSVQEVMDNEEKLAIISCILSKNKVPSLIYFSSKSSAESFTQQLYKKLPNHRIAYYHGGMDPIDRISIQQQFMNDQIDVICCTSAFGMGINKNNIRFVFHYHFPGQIESFIQEIGRAGRDGEQSVSILLYSKQDEFLPKQLIQSELPSDSDLTRVFQIVSRYAKQQQVIPADMVEVEALFEISETQWRFISSHLEKNSVLTENSLKYDQGKLTETFHLIREIRDERMKLKQHKLQDMISWIHSTECLRKELYTKFQHGYTVLTQQCCSNCGIDLTDFKPKQTVNASILPNWEMKLKHLFGLGDTHETE